MLLAALAAPADAAELSLGLAADVVVDPADKVDGKRGARAGTGGALRVPLRIGFAEGAALRATLGTTFTFGQDRVEWTQYDGAVTYYSDDHWTLVNSSSLMLGPVVDLTRTSARPYLGAQAGGVLVTSYHSFQGASAVLLDPAQGDVTSSTHIDPWSRDLVPAAELLGGLRLGGTDGGLAFEVEAGYTVAFLDEVALQKSRPELGAVRTAWGYNALRVGVGAVFSL